MYGTITEVSPISETLALHKGHTSQSFEVQSD